MYQFFRYSVLKYSKLVSFPEHGSIAFNGVNFGDNRLRIDSSQCYLLKTCWNAQSLVSSSVIEGIVSTSKGYYED